MGEPVIVLSLAKATRILSGCVKKPLLLFLLLAPFVPAPAHAQTFDLNAGRQPVASLDGLWRFHTGDNLAWADPNFDDSQWPLLRSDQDWDAQGYKGLSGFAWYRFTIHDPQGNQSLSLLLTYILTSYRVYADGKLIGGHGYLPPTLLDVPVDPMAFDLPPSSQSGPRTIHIAIRVWHDPLWAYYQSGGTRLAGNLAGTSSLIHQRLESSTQWRYAYLGNRYTYSVLASLMGLLVLGLFLFRPAESEYLWFALVLLASAADSALGVTYYLSHFAVEIFDTMDGCLLAIFQVAALLFFSRVLRARRSSWWWIACAAAVIEPFTTSLYILRFTSVPVSGAIEILLLLPSQLWILFVLVRRAAQKDADARLLLLPVFLAFGFNVADNLAGIAYQFGWQRRWFSLDVSVLDHPYALGLSAIINTIFVFAMMLFLIRRFSLARRAEERLETEVQAARDVQQYLIPERLPLTPGLAIESVYRPSREVGGDFFQVLPQAKDGSALIVVGDVAGKGMQAGMLATLIVGAIRTAASFTCDPGQILSLLNERMGGRGLATCLALRIEKDGNSVLANAGHLPPYLNGQELPIEGALPLGAVPGSQFPVLRFKLARGDSLMLMTDGVAEAQDAEGCLFGFDRIAEMLRSGIAAAAVATAAQNFGQEDDITVLTVALIAQAA